MHQGERELVEKAARGDEGAIEALLERHWPGLHAFVRLRAGHEILRQESSSDLAQSVCREVLERLDQYQYRGEGEFRAWLYTTAIRKILHRSQYYRAEKRDVRRHAEAGAPEGDVADLYRALSSPSGKLVTAEEVARIEAAFARLPEERREVILLSRFLGLSHREIAAHLGRSEAACRTLLVRALAELAENLREPAGPHGGPGDG